MGQAASMCRFRGCRYKKDKINKSIQQSNHLQQQQQQHFSSPILTSSSSSTNESSKNQQMSLAVTSQLPPGLHLRSIGEPTANNSLHPAPDEHASVGAQSSNPQQPAQTLANNCSPGLGKGGSVSGMPTEVSSSGGQSTNEQFHQQNNPMSCSSISSSKPYDAEYARMEAWMDENQEFVQDYFMRKATRQIVDAWLVSHATTSGSDTSSNSPTHTHATASGQSCSSRAGSGATTPVRKISAHEFERGGLLKPIVNTIDGTPTFLSVVSSSDCPSTATSTGSGTVGGSVSNTNIAGGQCHTNSGLVCGNSSPGIGSSSCSLGLGGAHSGNLMHHHHHHHQHHHHHRTQRLSRIELKQLDEKELIFELVKDICNELEVRTLCHKILQNVSILLNADRGSLFLVQGRCNEKSGEGPKKCLVSKLFDVCPRSTVDEINQQSEVQIKWGSGIAGHVAQSGEVINIPDAYQDPRFNREIDMLTGYRTKALLCMPIKDSSGDVIGVAQVINKMNGESFTETDEKIFGSYLQFCGIGLRNAQLYEKSQLEIRRNQVLLDLARMIFEEQSTIEHMVFRILTHMQSLIQCQRVQILLVHEATKGSFSRVFDFEANDLSQIEVANRTSPFESRFPINIGITGYVATTGETVNIPNAYEDDRFDPNVDEGLSFKHKSILCMAIKNSLSQIIGVIQLINKFDNLDFTKNDENFVEAFAIFCGMGIHNTHMYEKAVVAMAKQSVTLEVLSYHASATIDEAQRLRRLRVPSAAYFQLHDFRFDDLKLEDDDTLKACLRMFLDLDFIERFHIDYEVLCRWLLSVKKNYRNVIYHNWRHAFNVAQMMFAILTATQWWKIFGEIECLALVIACLCHDLDHRGTNNSFQIKASSPLARLYSTSTMEHHHFDQCLMILNSPGNQILANLSSEDYCRVIKVLEDAILSTDLAIYFRKRTTFLNNVKEQPISYWLEEEPRSLLRAMCMTVCDLSAITKPWEIEKRIAELVSSEFFEQGDMEKQELNLTPIDLMNREKEDELPQMQVGFIDSICMPMYEAFAQLSDKLEPLVEGVRKNRQHWMELAQEAYRKNDDLRKDTNRPSLKKKKSNGIMEENCKGCSDSHHYKNSNTSSSSSSGSNNNSFNAGDSSSSLALDSVNKTKSDSTGNQKNTDTSSERISSNARDASVNCSVSATKSDQPNVQVKSFTGVNSTTLNCIENHQISSYSQKNVVPSSCGVTSAGIVGQISNTSEISSQYSKCAQQNREWKKEMEPSTSNFQCENDKTHIGSCYKDCICSVNTSNRIRKTSIYDGDVGGGDDVVVENEIKDSFITTAPSSDSDKIPKIVGKLSNVESLHQGTINGNNITAIPNGHIPSTVTSSSTTLISSSKAINRK